MLWLLQGTLEAQVAQAAATAHVSALQADLSAARESAASEAAALEASRARCRELEAQLSSEQQLAQEARVALEAARQLAERRAAEADEKASLGQRLQEVNLCTARETAFIPRFCTSAQHKLPCFTGPAGRLNAAISLQKA